MGWVCLTGRAGTGKGPTLHAAAEAYRAAGWRVIACAMDGTTARRMAEQLGGKAPAVTVEQLKVRLEAGAIKVDGRMVIVVDEASKLDTGHWGELAKAVERHGARVRAVGHDGQHEAIRLPGLFSEMLADERIPTAELRQIRRHRDPQNPSRMHPWLRDYQIAVDEGRGVDAVAILQDQDALRLYDARAQAMTGLVEEWDSWRRGYEPGESALIVHGPNADVDLVNELAQRKRLAHGELGEHGIRAVDRGYLLRPGDVVAVRNAAYTFDAEPDRRPKRVENGQVAIVESVDVNRDTLTLMLREPGAEPRLVEIDQARLRAQHAAGERAAAVRLQYAMHSFPAQGATVRGTATLAGHSSQAKRETYVGDTRAVYRHSVHVAREDLGVDGSDQDRVLRYAQRISENRQRQASIRSALDPTLQLAVTLPDEQPLPRQPAPRLVVGRPSDTSPRTSPSTGDTSPPVAARAAAGDTSREPSARTSGQADARRPRLDEHLQRVLADPPQQLLDALGPPPEERVARERWEREARRLEALRMQTGATQQPGGAAPGVQPSQDRLARERWEREARQRDAPQNKPPQRQAPGPPPPHPAPSANPQRPSGPPPRSQRRGGPTIGR